MAAAAPRTWPSSSPTTTARRWRWPLPHAGFDLEDELLEPTSRYLALAGGRAAPLDASAAAAHFARAERVTAEASRPRRWLLSRRTRRTLKRRAPLLAAAAAVIVVALVAALAVLEFRPTHDKPSGPVQLTAQQIADKYGDSIVEISARVRVADKQHRIVWKRVHESGVVVSKDGLIYTSDDPLGRWPVVIDPVVVTVGVYADDGYHAVRGYKIPLRTGERHHDADQDRPASGTAQARADTGGGFRGGPEGDRVVGVSRLGGLLLRSAGRVASTMSGSRAMAGSRFSVLQLATNRPPKSPTGGALVDETGHLIGVMGPGYKDATGAAPYKKLDWTTSPGAATGVDFYSSTIDFTQLAIEKNAQPVTFGIDYWGV